MTINSFGLPFKVRREVVVGDSMLPLLADGDWLLMLENSAIKQGEIVVARQPDQPGRRIVKKAVRADSNGWWLEGLNADSSEDSRSFGPVAHGWIEGVVVARYWPRPRLLVSLNRIR